MKKLSSAFATLIVSLYSVFEHLDGKVWQTRPGRYPGGAQLWGLPGGIVRRLRRRRAKPA